MYRQIAKTWGSRKEELAELSRARLIKWRAKAIECIERPTRLDRARVLGYKNKRGCLVVRARIRKGGSRKQRPSSGRRPKAMGVTRYSPGKSLKKIAEGRVSRKYPNLRVLNSYYVGEDGRYKWYEVILIDPILVKERAK